MPEESSNGFWWHKLLIAAAGAAVAAFATLGGMLLQDRLDLLKTNRELVIRYTDEAEESAKAVEGVIQSIFASLTDPAAVLSDAQVEELRSALLDLRRDTEKVAIQVDSVNGTFQEYSEAMADLMSVAQMTENGADADPLLEAISAFYYQKRQFELDVVEEYRPKTS